MKTIAYRMFFFIFILCQPLAGCAESPPPSPPKAATESAQKIIQYFCEQWKEGNYESMYYALSESMQKKITIETWIEKYKKDTNIRGLLKEFEISGPDEDLGSKSLWTIKTTMKNNVVGTLEKHTWAIELEDGWRIDEGGLMPSDI